LEDESGNRISPKEYLENALKPLKGFSESIENKNKIRYIIYLSLLKDVILFNSLVREIVLH
jgi:hypothetical protein